MDLPPGVDIADFLLHDGRPPEPPAAIGNTPVARELDLAAFRDRYLEMHRPSLERRTVEGIELHFRHLAAMLGAHFPICELRLADLQRDVDTRVRAKGASGNRLSPATIRNEIVSLRTAWNWAV